MTEATEDDCEAGNACDMPNQARLCEKLEAGTLAERLAGAYDATETEKVNGDALKQVVEDELNKVRKALEQDKNQVD